MAAVKTGFHENSKTWLQGYRTVW